MSDSIAVNPSPTSKADVFKVYSASSWIDTTALTVGSTSKGNQDQSVWIIFEPNIPAGSTLVSVEVDLYMNILGGLVTTVSNVLAGWLALDGTWNVQTSSLGWDEYTGNVAPTDYPAIHVDRTGASDSDWINNFPAFDLALTVGTDVPASGTHFQFGGGSGISPTFSASAFLDDAQDVFDANETNRTARGVPMAFVFVPQGAELVQWAMISNEGVTTSQRPELTIVYDPPPIAAELSSTSSMDADLDATYGAATELSAATTLDADTVITRGVASELGSTAALDADISLIAAGAAELAGSAAVDADATLIRVVASELSSSAALDADISLIAAGAAELIAQASLDADTVITRGAASELSSTTTLDAQLVGLFFLDTELFSTTTIDAAVRPSETAANPQEVFYMAQNQEVRYKTDSAIITMPDTNVEVTKPVENAEVGAD